MVTSIAVMRMPSMPEVAEPLRGKFLVSVRIAYNGTTADGERMIEPLRAVAPAVLDTVRDMSYAEVASIHNEPTDAVPYYERGIMLREFPPQAQDKVIELVGPDAETDLAMAELRALGGAWDREPKVPNAVATRGLPYSLLGVSAGPLSEEEQLKMSVANLLDGMKPWQGARRYVNNLAPDEAADPAAIYGPERYERLASIKNVMRRSSLARRSHGLCRMMRTRRNDAEEEVRFREAVASLMLETRRDLNNLSLIPRRGDSDIALLALLSKSIVVAEAVVSLVANKFEDEAYELCRTAVEIELTIRYLTNRETTARCARYVNFYAKDKTEWDRLIDKYYPEMITKSNRAEDLERLAAAYPNPHGWSECPMV